MDWTSGPVTTTGLVSGWSRAAFRGLTELKSTPDRQPVKPREASRDSPGSNSAESGDKGYVHASCWISMAADERRRGVTVCYTRDPSSVHGPVTRR